MTRSGLDDDDFANFEYFAIGPKREFGVSENDRHSGNIGINVDLYIPLTIAHLKNMGFAPSFIYRPAHSFCKR
jgi:hypothetical protein